MHTFQKNSKFKPMYLESLLGELWIFVFLESVDVYLQYSKILGKNMC